MEVLSLCQFPAAPLIWQVQPGRWVLTIVCKGTYGLEPGVVSIAPDQEPICEEDQHLGDDPGKSVVRPADLVPFKPRADVVLVGSAFARGGQPARSLVARVSVGKIDKSIEVICARVRTRDGELREGKLWTKMPLVWERAAGGPGTNNPVGVSLSGKQDQYGQLHLPTLQTPGFVFQDGKLPPPIGFGPLGADWPDRRSHAGSAAGKDVARAPFGPAFDPAHFQVAPPDQQLDVLSPNERLTLENLHPEHASLVTSLPGTVPRARVELPGSAPREIALVPDTLWIDTDRAVCTVTYRAKLDVDSAEPRGRVLVALPKGDRAIRWAALAPPPPPPPSPRPSAPAPPSPRPSAPPGVVVPTPPPRPRASTPGAPPARASQPSRASPPSRASQPAPPPRASQPAPASQLTSAAIAALQTLTGVEPDEEEAPESDIEITMSEVHSRPLHETAPVRPITRPMPPSAPEGSALPFQPAPAGWEPPAAKPSRPGFPASPAPQGEWVSTPVLGIPAARTTLPDWFESGAMPDAVGAMPDPITNPIEPSAFTPVVAPPPLLTSPAWKPLPPPDAPPTPLLGALPEDGSFGLLEVSNAAAGLRGERPASTDDTPAPKAEVASRPPAPAVESVTVELLWFDPTLAPNPALASPAPVQPESPAPSPESLLRGRVYETLSRGSPTSLGALEAALDRAEEQSPPGAAVVLVQGTLELGLDEVEMLKAVVAAASPLASSDKKLKEAIDVAAEVLKAPMQGMPDFVQGLAGRIRDAWAKANRLLPPDHLMACTERLLLEQRSYQKRDLLDDTWIRAVLSGQADSASVPVYLPAKISRRLPLFRRFPVRLIGEVVYQQDQYETCAVAIRALALGRLPPRSRARSPKRA